MSSNIRNRPHTQSIKSFDVPQSNKIILPSGHGFHLSESAIIGVVRVELFWAAGSYHQSKPYVGSMSNDLLFAGNNNRSEFEVVEYLDYLGASHRTECGHLGSSVVIKASKKNIIAAVEWVVDNIHSAEYPEKEINIAKQVRTAALERQQKTPKYWSNRLALEELYGKNHPLGIHGDLTDYEAITQPDLMQFKATHYHFNNAMLFVSGDTDDALVDQLANILNPFQGTLIEISQPKYIHVTKQIYQTPILHAVEGTNQTSLMLVQHVAPVDQTQRFGLTLLNLVLGGYFGSRLMQILREEKGLTYGIGSYFKPAFNDYTWTISGDLNSTNINEAIESIHTIFEELKQTSLSDIELNKIKQYYSGQFRSGFDGPFAMGNKIQHLMYRGLPNDYYSTVLPGIWAITAKDIIELANNYLHPNSFIHVLSGDTP